MSVNKVRDPLFDVVKFVLMYFVIRGHLQAANIVTPDSSSPAWLGCVVVGVSMPLFFIISGMFSRRVIFSNEWSEAVSRIVSFVWPALSVGFVFGLYSFLRRWSWSPDPFCTAIAHLRFLWFLRTLAVVYLVTAVVVKCFRGTGWRWGFFILAYACMIINPPRFGLWWLGDVMHMFPYFVPGLMVPVEKLYRNVCVVTACGVMFLVVVFTEGRITTNGMGFYWVSSYWKDMLLTEHGFLCFVGRTVVGVVGSVFVLGLFRLAIDRLPVLSRCACFGTTTLGVYAIHQLLLQRLGAHTPFPVAPSWKWLITFVVFIACHYVVVFVRKYKFSRFVLFGDEGMVRAVLNKVGIL